MRLKEFLHAAWIYRAWYYFRIGYATYLTILLGFASTLVTVYYLAIKSVPPLLNIFPRFIPFAIVATFLGVPIAAAIGWLHLKRTRFYSSETDILVESNPYNYRLTPGIQMEFNAPSLLAQLRILKRIAEANGLLTDSEKAEIEALEKKCLTLLQGGYVGTPRRKNNF